MIYSAQGKYDDALELYNKALNICIATFGENHPNVAGSYNNIAVIYYNQGKYDDALELLNKALNILLQKPIENKELIDFIKTAISEIEERKANGTE